nr:uncharacterized protein LOC128697149 isoform X1 [Cherax quadricarinatus]
MWYKFGGKDSDFDNDSEFGSEEEELECGLYAQLYFESNPDYHGGRCELPELSQENKKRKLHHDETYTQDSGLRSRLSPHSTPICTTAETGSVVSFVADNQTNGKTQEDFAVSASSSKTPTVSVRESIYSKGSIPGSKPGSIPESIPGNISGIKPLDSLHCTIEISDDTEEDVNIDLAILDKKRKENHIIKDDLSEKTKKRKLSDSHDSFEFQREKSQGSLAHASFNTTKISVHDCKKDGSSKLTMTKSENSDSSDFEREESRYSSFPPKESKSRNVNKLKRNCDLTFSSDSESDAHILPPPSSKHYDTVSVLSGSGNELEKRVKVKESQRKKLRDNSSVLLLEQSCSNNKKAIVLKKPETVASDSRSDSVLSLSTRTKGTNVNTDLSSIILKLKKDTCVSKQTKVSTSNNGLQTTRCSLNFTKNRPDTVKKPTCNLWTQDMINFYDSDISEDLELETVHDQQTTDNSGPGLEQLPTRRKPWIKVKVHMYRFHLMEMNNFQDFSLFKEELSDEGLSIKNIEVTLSFLGSDERSAWHIIAADYQVKPNLRYFAQMDRCIQCRQFGHKMNNCPKVPRCNLCSETDHTSRCDCPNDCCFRHNTILCFFQCGGKHFYCSATSRAVTCSTCSFPGHCRELCPDLWRRFHLTTSGVEVNTPVKATPRPVGDKFCCNCGKRGHYGYDCELDFYKRSYVQVTQSVISYSTPFSFANEFDVIPTGPKLENRVFKLCLNDGDAGRILGKRGVIIKEIQKRSGAAVEIINENGVTKVLMSGSTPACCDARAMVEVLLGRRPVNKLRDFVLHVFDLNRQVLHVNEVDDVYNLWMPLNLYDYSQNLASSWYEECIEKLGRNKKSVIKVLKQYIKTCQESFSPIFNNLNETLNVLRGFAGKICLERKSIEAVHTELSRVLCALVCHEKYGHDFRSKFKKR